MLIFNSSNRPIFTPTDSFMTWLVLFGSSHRPWNIDHWQQVSDTLRGGTSYAKFQYLDPSNPSAGISFNGNLDTKTLGGAAFASQVYQHPINIKSNQYSGFFLELEPIQNHHDSINKFTLGLKNTPITPHFDQESSLIYQFDFKVPRINITTPRTLSQDSQIIPTIKINIPFNALIPTFRGKPKTDEKPFDPHHITQISIMSRSFFNQQSGKFHLNILKLGLESHQHELSNTP